MGYRVVRAGEYDWIERPAAEGQEPRHMADLTPAAALTQSPARSREPSTEPSPSAASTAPFVARSRSSQASSSVHACHGRPEREQKTRARECALWAERFGTTATNSASSSPATDQP